jgi:acetolactate synthase-1/2/3 large subunit
MKPVILIGAGCPQSLADVLCSLGVPVLVSWQGIDLVPEDSPVFCGRPGVVGQRAANIIQQKCDVLYIFGARMDGEQVGHRIDKFAPRAHKFVWDVDPAELDKLPTDWTIIQQDLTHEFQIPPVQSSWEWLAWCKALYNEWRYELDGSNQVEDFVDPYYFINALSKVCEEGEVIVPGSSGMQSCALMQAFKVKRNQRILLCNTTGAMGMEPMAIGAAIASKQRVICVTGDGGFFMNMQELETVKRMNLNIKFFVFCNSGYGSITTMQDARFNLRVGGDSQSGFTLPDLARVAAVWDFPYYKINNNLDCDLLAGILESPRAAIVRVNTTLAFRYATKVNSSLVNGQFVNDEMENMTPKIDIERIMK